LYLQALREFCKIHRHIHHSADHRLDDDISRLKHLIRSNYWFSKEGDTPDDVYHEVLYEKGRRTAHRCADRYWTSFFSPVGYGYRFDTLANMLQIRSKPERWMNIRKKAHPRRNARPGLECRDCDYRPGSFEGECSFLVV